MPTYEYLCDFCDHEFEIVQPITADALKKCPKCKKKVRRLISGGGGILFKGSGFYQTDYRSESYKKAAKKDQEKASGKSGDSSKNKGDKPKGDKPEPSKKKEHGTSRGQSGASAKADKH